MRIPAFQGLLIPFLLTIVVAGGIVGCTTGKLWSFDEASEVEAGSKQHKLMLGQIGAYNDTKISDFVSSIGDKVASASDRPDLRWHFTVLDSAIPNAFATQGGYVYITRGMLALLQSDAELAAILSHEIAHICAQDTPHKQAVGNMMGLGMLGMIVAAPALLLVPQIAAAPAGAGMAAISRKDELNADRLGAEYLQRTGFPPETMQTAMEVLTSMEAYERAQRKSAGSKTSQWWHRVYASHPATEKRQERLAEMTNQPHPETASTPQPAFLARLNGIEFGSAKFEGIPYNHKRYFAQWRLALEVPEGWLVWMDEKRDQLWLVRPDWKARLQLERITTLDVDNPCKTLTSLMAPSSVTELKSVREYGPSSCTGVIHKSTPTLFGGHKQIIRAGVIANSKAAWYGYSFYGYADENAFIENDAIFLSVARSTESVQGTDGQPKPLSLHIHLAKMGDSFASLARNSRILGNNAESLLRLLNRRYPIGEPAVGELIKTID